MPTPSIVTVPAKNLHRPSQPVVVSDTTRLEAAKEDLASLTIAMRQAHGLGLAAPQIGLNQRLMVAEYANVDDKQAFKLLQLINPSYQPVRAKTVVSNEGCLSLPGFELPIERYEQIKVTATLADGQVRQWVARDLESRVIQHEIDHLDGVLITDRAIPELERLKTARVVFFGSNHVSLSCLYALLATTQVVAVVTETDKLGQDGVSLRANPVAQLARQLDLPLLQFDSINQVEAVKALTQYSADFGYCVAYGQLFKASTLESLDYPIFNLHFSLLPDYPGATPHLMPILNGDQQTGITLFKISPKLDAGPILTQAKYKLTQTETGPELLQELTNLGILASLRALVDWRAGRRELTTTLKPKEVKYAGKLTKESGLIDWRLPAIQIERQIRALAGWPGSYFFIGDERVIIESAYLERGKLTIEAIKSAGRSTQDLASWLRQRPDRLTYLESTGKINL